MTSTLSTRRGLLTRACNRLSALLKDQASLQESPTLEADNTRARELRRKPRSARTTTEAELRNVETASETTSWQNLDPETPAANEILQKVATNAETGQDLVNSAQTTLTMLARLNEELQDAEDTLTTGIAPINLAPVPIPKFSERIWEWQNFWNAFIYSVHSRNIDNFYKMTYLLDALHGEAKDSAKQFEISSQTYPLVIAHLYEKYGLYQALVDVLLKKLHSCIAKSDSINSVYARNSHPLYVNYN